MKLHSYEDTDSLHFLLSNGVSAGSRELSVDLVVDSDSDGRIVGFDIQHASEQFDLSRIETSHLPVPIAAS